MPLPALKQEHALTEEQIAELESEDSFLRGTQALSIFNEAIKETGVVVPRDFVFKNHERGVVEKAMHATFGLLGGVPAMLLWASRNPTEFYRMYGKLSPSETVVSGGGNTVVITQIPDSPLDTITLHDNGKVVDAEYE